MKGLLNYLLFTSIFVSFSIFGCSSSDDVCDDHQSRHIRLTHNSNMDLDDFIHWNHGRKTLSFYDDEDFGDNIQWKVVLDDGDIVKLYRDGKRLSGSEISDNQTYIYEKLNEIAEDMRDLKVDLKEMEADLADIDFDFDFDFDFEFDNESFSMDINFDGEDFAESMEELGEALSKLKTNKYSYHFDDDDDWDWDDEEYSHWDKKEFKREMKKLKRELRKLDDIEIDIDMDEFNESMEELRENLKDLDIDMSDLKKDMKKLKGFLKDVSSELEWDGYIDDADEDFELELDEDEMIVNGKKLPGRLHRKYLKMYKQHFGKELDDGFYVHR